MWLKKWHIRRRAQKRHSMAAAGLPMGRLSKIKSVSLCITTKRDDDGGAITSDFAVGDRQSDKQLGDVNLVEKC